MEAMLPIIAVRLANAILWTAYIARVVATERPVTSVARRLIGSVIVFGMWALTFGGVAGLDPSDLGGVARNLYTAFTTYAAITALALLSERE